MNVGATSPEQPGLFFSWGNSPGHAEGDEYDFSQEVYEETTGAAIEANLTLDADMARLSMGTPWRLPTATEFKELYDNCTSEWTRQNGVYGLLFTSSVNGKTIFFPAAGRYDGTLLQNSGTNGYYWSSTYNSDTYARDLSFSNGEVNPQNLSIRRYGVSARAVADV